jgi:hypothetical protein
MRAIPCLKKEKKKKDDENTKQNRALCKWLDDVRLG